MSAPADAATCNGGAGLPSLPISLNATALSVGPPEIIGKGGPEWPTQCKTAQCWSRDLPADKWIWQYSDGCISGVWVPSVYSPIWTQLVMGDICLNTFGALKETANETLAERPVVPQFGYNLELFPAEPLLQGIATGEVQTAESAFTGKAIDASEPSYVVMG